MSLEIEAGYDLADIGDFDVDVVETGGATFSITFTSGKYFFKSTGASLTGGFSSKVTAYTGLLAAVSTALNAATGSGAYTVAHDLDANRVTIEHSGGAVTAFSLTWQNNGGLLGFTTNRSAALTYTGDRDPDYYIQGSEGGLTDSDGDYEGGDEVAYDIEAHDGSPSGLAKDGAPIYFDCVVPLEPVAIVGNFPSLVSATAPWTWKSLFQHCRNVYPIAIDQAAFYRLRADAAKFEPRRLGDNYRGHYDIPLRLRLLGRY